MTRGSPGGGPAAASALSAAPASAVAPVTLPDRITAVVVGGGVVGCAVLWRLARAGVQSLLVDRATDVGEGASKANSGIIHTGFDAEPGTLEANLLRRAARLWPELLEELGVPSLRVGALMVARTAEERLRLDREVRARATSLGVETELLGRAELRAIAPYLSDDVTAALSIPDEAVVDPFWLTRGYAEAAVADGALVSLGAAVVRLEPEDDGVLVHLDGGSSVRAEQVFDCAGVRADEVARTAGDRSFAITPRKGQFLVSEEAFGVDRIVLPIPGPMGKGMLVTPIVFGGLLLGPTAEDQADKDDRDTDTAARERILRSCMALVPALAQATPIRSFAGLRTVSSTGAYIVRPSAVTDRLFLVAGIRSTGVSASPAIAERAVEDAGALRGWNPRRRAAPASARRLVERPAGEVVCPCRSVSRGEVEAALLPEPAPTTLDAVKRRCGALFGDCQGGLCTVDVARLIARERGCPVTAVERADHGSRLFWRARGARTAGARSLGRPARGARARPTRDRVAVLVLGGGRAGLGVATALQERGVDVLVIERRPSVGSDRLGWSAEERAVAEGAASGVEALVATTAVGLEPGPEGWLVQAQDAGGAVQVRADEVVVATGGYVAPWEHRGIAGPRPEGLVTADLVERAREVGLRVGRRAVLVGRGRTADATSRLLEAAGCRVVCRLDACRIEAVRGARRVTGALVDGEWLECDTVVLADRLVPAPLVLRTVGLVDGRVGVAAPADELGRLPQPGLWAAGTCVDGDIDHAGSTRSGRALGSAIARLRAGRAGGR